jgi:hypothetical protein
MAGAFFLTQYRLLRLLTPDADFASKQQLGRNDMKKSSLALILGAVLLGAGGASAATESLLIHGSSCFNTTAGVNISYSQWGPYNSSTATGVTVNCPVTMPSRNYVSMFLQVSGWSRNNSANKLSCTVNNTGYDGFSLSSNTATIPYNPGAANTWTTTINPSWQNVWPYITCYIPPNNGNGISYLSTIYLQGTY